MPMAGASTASPFLRTDPAPPALPLADVSGENEPWRAALVWGTRKTPRVSAQVFGSGREGSVRAVAGRDPWLHRAEGSRLLPRMEKWFPYSF